MKIQLSKTRTVEWTPPWEKKADVVDDIVGVELGSGNAEGCPAVRLQRHRDAYEVVAVGFVPPPDGSLPASWDDLRHQPHWSLPSAFRADFAALTVNSVDAFTNQTAAAPFLENPTEHPEGIAVSKNGVRSTFRRILDESSVIQATIPEYQALWINRLLPEGRKPTAISLQTTFCSLLASLSAQPEFCQNGDEAAVFVTQSAICIAGFRQGQPLLFRECPGAAGAAAMREAVKTALGIDEAMLDTVFNSNGIIDTRPALSPLLMPVLSQIELSLDYLKGRLGSELKRMFVMGDAAGCTALRRIIDERISLPIVAPNPFEGLILPAKSVSWKERYCVGELPQVFLTALGAALAVLGDAS